MDDIKFNSNDCGSCPIRKRAVCARCDDDELAHLETIKYYRSFESGQTIVWVGDEVDFLASVVTGVATLTQTMEDGRTQMVGLLLPSDFLGRPGRSTMAFTVTAISDVTLCCFRRKPFEEMLQDSHHIVQRLLTMTLDELDAAREWMLILGRKTAREKVASLLAIFLRRDAGLHLMSPADGMSFDLPLTREAMADYLGLTLETVSRQISALKRDGVINLTGNRHVTVQDVELLQAETGDDVAFLA